MYWLCTGIRNLLIGRGHSWIWLANSGVTILWLVNLGVEILWWLKLGQCHHLTMSQSNPHHHLPSTICLVCHTKVHLRDLGLKLQCCGNYQCEECMSILAEHCSICDRTLLNMVIPCENCGRGTKMYQSRACSSCEMTLHCVSCEDTAICPNCNQ